MLICNGLTSKVLVEFDNGIYRCRKSKVNNLKQIVSYVAKWDSKVFLYSKGVPIPKEAKLIVIPDVSFVNNDVAEELLKRSLSCVVIVRADYPLWFWDKDDVCEAKLKDSNLSFEFVGTFPNYNEYYNPVVVREMFRDVCAERGYIDESITTFIRMNREAFSVFLEGVSIGRFIIATRVDNGSVINVNLAVVKMLLTKTFRCKFSGDDNEYNGLGVTQAMNNIIDTYERLTKMDLAIEDVCRRYERVREYCIKNNICTQDDVIKICDEVDATEFYDLQPLWSLVGATSYKVNCIWIAAHKPNVVREKKDIKFIRVEVLTNSQASVEEIKADINNGAKLALNEVKRIPTFKANEELLKHLKVGQVTICKGFVLYTFEWKESFAYAE